MWLNARAARRMLAEQADINFRKGLEKSVETLKRRAAQLKEMSRDAHDEGNVARKLQLQEMRTELLQIAEGLRKLKPGAEI